MKAKSTTSEPPKLTAQDIDEDAMRLQLITAQYELRASVQQKKPRGLLVLVSGIETSGKGKAVTHLREWMDPRLLKISHLPTQYPSKHLPIWQRHALPLPRHGEVTVMFGGWYADLIYAFVKGKLSKRKLAMHLQHIAEFERDLCANHTQVVKCWFDIDDDTLKRRLKDNKSDPERLYKLDWLNKKQVSRVRQFKHLMMEHKSLNDGIRWHEIDGQSKDIANQQFADIVLQGLVKKAYTRPAAKRNFLKSDIPSQLIQPSQAVLAKSVYKKRLKKLQNEFAELMRKQTQHIVMVFEGMDAAGKGGAIRRVVSPLDPREYRIHNIAAPEPEELQHPYLWRFWHRLPEQVGLTIFDRSWYGRVLVERIEGFAQPAAWQAAYDEINRFEQHLANQGVRVLKFWLAIDKDVQLQRFKERENTPHKQYKITPDDWRNRKRWDAYVQAAADMLDRTSTADNPWHVVATNDKYTARLAVLEHCIDRMSGNT